MPRRRSDHAAERERFVEDLLAIMTVEEKVGQLVLQRPPVAGDSSHDHQIRDQLRRGHLGGFVGWGLSSEYAAFQRIAVEETRLGIPLFIADAPGRGETAVLPSSFAFASSWDCELAERSARLIAGEAQAAGRNWLLGPDVSLCTSVTDSDLVDCWGSVELLARRMAAAWVRGFQSEDVREPGLLACLRLDDPSWTVRRDTRRMRDKLRLIAGVLRISDPGSVALGAMAHGFPDLADGSREHSLSIGEPGGYEGLDLAGWSKIAAAAGLEMASGPFEGLPHGAMVAAIEDGRIAPFQIDDEVRKVIGAKYDLGLFSSEGLDRHTDRAIEAEETRALALDAARHAIVLLRNEPALLPLGIDSGDIVVVGPAATDRALPTGSSGREGASLTDGFDALGIAYKYVPGLALRQGGSDPGRLAPADRMAIGLASEAARRSQTVIAVLGAMAELGEAQRNLLEGLRSANRNTILVTLGSHPLDPDILGSKLSCVLHAGQLGSMSGHAIAEVLTGAFAPRGRLPVALIDNSREGLPLGHGLGFSPFRIEEPRIELGHNRIVVTSILRNVGEREGMETVQLYLRRPIDRGAAERTLVDFQRISLGAGKSCNLMFELGGNQLGHFETNGKFTVEPGAYEISVGLSERRAFSEQISVPRAVVEAMSRDLASEPLPALFGKLRSVG